MQLIYIKKKPDALRFFYNLILLSLNELLITDTELNDIAKAANIGLSNPKAASGIPITL